MPSPLGIIVVCSMVVIWLGKSPSFSSEEKDLPAKVRPSAHSEAAFVRLGKSLQNKV